MYLSIKKIHDGYYVSIIMHNHVETYVVKDVKCDESVVNAVKKMKTGDFLFMHANKVMYSCNDESITIID